MHVKFILSILVGLLIFFTACKSDGNSKANQVNYNAIAQELCNCAQPSILLQVEMETLNKAKKKDEMRALFSKAGKTFDKVLECSKDYMFTQNKDGLDTDQLKAELIKQCKDMPRKMADEMVLKI